MEPLAGLKVIELSRILTGAAAESWRNHDLVVIIRGHGPLPTATRGLASKETL